MTTSRLRFIESHILKKGMVSLDAFMSIGLEGSFSSSWPSVIDRERKVRGHGEWIAILTPKIEL